MGYLDNVPANISEDELKALQSLEAKRIAAIERLGEKWVLHEKHMPKHRGLSMDFVGKHIEQAVPA